MLPAKIINPKMQIHQLKMLNLLVEDDIQELMVNYKILESLANEMELLSSPVNEKKVRFESNFEVIADSVEQLEYQLAKEAKRNEKLDAQNEEMSAEFKFCRAEKSKVKRQMYKLYSNLPSAAKKAPGRSHRASRDSVQTMRFSSICSSIPKERISCGNMPIYNGL